MLISSLLHMQMSNYGPMLCKAGPTSHMAMEHSKGGPIHPEIRLCVKGTLDSRVNTKMECKNLSIFMLMTLKMTYWIH